MLREIDALLRRVPDLGILSAPVEELRSEPEDDVRPGTGASALTTAELRVMPYLNAPVLAGGRRANVHLATHGEVTRDGHLSQAQRHLRKARSSAPASSACSEQTAANGLPGDVHPQDVCGRRRIG